MSSANFDPAAIFHRVLEYAAQNLRFEKLLVQLGLDPTNVTYEAIFNRLLDIAIANISFANMFALIGASLYVATLMVRTIVPLRIIGIISIVFFIGYGVLAGAVATFFLYLLSLPINVIRLRQMLNLVKKARISAQGDLSMDWLRPFMTPRKCKKGEVLFHKGDVAKEMFLTVTGTFLVKEIGIELPPGRIMGELGFIDPKNRRTATVETLEQGEVLTITYDRLLELYFQNPEFGYYFLRLTTERLMQNIARLEGISNENKKRLAGTVDPVPTADASTPRPQDPKLAKSVDPEQVDEPPNSRPNLVVAARRDKVASELVDRFSVWAGAASLIPVPIFDIAAVGGVQLQMLRGLSEIFGVPFSENRGKSIIASLAGAIVPASTATTMAMAFGSLLKGLPGVGSAIGALSMPLFSAGVTYVIGKVFIQHFASGGTLLDFNSPDYREFIKVQQENWTRAVTPERTGGPVRKDRTHRARRKAVWRERFRRH